MTRVSLRELLLVMAFVAIAIVSLKYASETWRVVVTAITMLTFIGTAIAAVVDRGPRQAFAIGMLTAMTIYGSLLFNGRDPTRSPRAGTSNIEFISTSTFGNLPTTRIHRRLYTNFRHREWFNRDTGEAFDEDPRGSDPPRPGAARVLYRVRDLPPEGFFMVIGHCLWAMLLGYLGGRFAKFIYLRRLPESKSLAAESS